MSEQYDVDLMQFLLKILKVDLRCAHWFIFTTCVTV